VHPAYVADDADAQEALVHLSKAGVLVDPRDQPAEALELLARAPVRSRKDAVKVADTDLLVLREAWARMARERQRTLAERVGLNIQLRVVHYVNRKATADWARPDEACPRQSTRRRTPSQRWRAKPRG